MNNFLEIKNVHGTTVLINISKIEYIYESNEDPRYSALIFMSDGSNIKVTESIEFIKERLK